MLCRGNLNKVAVFIVTLYVSAAHSPSLAEKAPSWLCVADSATGFSFEKGQWRPTNFVTAKKYLLAEGEVPHRNRQLKYQWKEMGQSVGSECDERNSYGSIRCDFPHHVVFNAQTLRYLKWYPYGYVDGADNNQNTPHIEIGRCSPLG
jgi:hypothetical protein